MKEFEHSRNTSVKPFEMETPKDIRACAVKKCCSVVKTGVSLTLKMEISDILINISRKRRTSDNPLSLLQRREEI